MAFLPLHLDTCHVSCNWFVTLELPLFVWFDWQVIINLIDQTGREKVSSKCLPFCWFKLPVFSILNPFLLIVASSCQWNSNFGSSLQIFVKPWRSIRLHFWVWISSPIPRKSSAILDSLLMIIVLTVWYLWLFLLDYWRCFYGEYPSLQQSSPDVYHFWFPWILVSFKNSFHKASVRKVINNDGCINHFVFFVYIFSRGMKFENVSVLVESITDELKDMRYCW